MHPYQFSPHFLGSKDRVGVTKFTDDTKLFFGPPYDFTNHVLNSPHLNNCFGVALKFIQQIVTYMYPNPSYRLLHDPLQIYVQIQQFSSSHVDYREIPTR